MMNDPWVDQFLRRPDVRAQLYIFVRIVRLSSLVALAAGFLLLVLYCAAVV